MYAWNEHRWSFGQLAARQVAEPRDQGMRLAETKVIDPNFLDNRSLGALGRCWGVCLSNFLVTMVHNVIRIRGMNSTHLTSYVSGAKRNWCLSASLHGTFLVWQGYGNLLIMPNAQRNPVWRLDRGAWDIHGDPGNLAVDVERSLSRLASAEHGCVRPCALQ